LQYQINEAWYVRATYGYINAEYNAYLADITGDQIVTDNSGLSPRNTPEGTMGLTTTYTVPVGTGDVKAMLSYRWRDSVETIATNDPLGTLPSISDISASVSYAWSDERYRITAFGRNITDEREKQVARISPLTTRGYWNEGATYGVELSASF
jgi:iron complex outermembrane recepter protein